MTSGNMRILHCIHSLSGGGAETQLRILSGELRRKGCPVAIFYVNGQPNSQEDVDYYRCTTGKYPFGLVGEIRKTIAAFKPDVMHAWLPATINISSLVAAAMEEVPVVSSIRNKRRIDGVQRLISYVSTWFLSDLIVTNNPIEQSSKAYQRLFRRKQGMLINNAVISSGKRKIDTHKRGDELKILFVGRLTKQKNLEILIKALALVKGDVEFSLDVYGVGELEGSLRRRVDDSGLANKVSFKGFQDSVALVMHEYDLLVLPSIYEGMPNVVVEALASRLPALVSDIPAHKLLFTNDEVMFFDVDSAESLGIAIKGFYDNPEEGRDMMDRAEQFVIKRTPSSVAVQYIEAYGNLLKR